MSLRSFINKLAIFNLLHKLFSKKMKQPQPESTIPYDYDLESYINNHLADLQNRIDKSEKSIADLRRETKLSEQHNLDQYDADELDDRMDMLESELDNHDPDSEEYAALLDEIYEIQNRLDDMQEAEEIKFNRLIGDFDNNTDTYDTHFDSDHSHFDSDFDSGFDSDYSSDLYDDRW